MKALLTLLILLTVTFASAQIVNIPDPKFKTVLLDMIDVNLNNDAEIQESEAVLVTSVNLPSGKGITDITGIRSFTNLQYLVCWNNALTGLDLNGLKRLKNVTADNNLLTSINITGCDSLTFLAIEGNKLTSLDLRGFNSLETLVCGSSKQLSTLNTRGCARLRSVSCSNNIMVSADLRDCDSLRSADFFDSYLQTLDVSGSRNLERVLDNTTVDNLIARGCIGLKTVNTGFITRGINNFLDVTDCINLEKIYIQESNLLTLDVSTCINLKELSFYVHGQGLKYLNIKNGSSLDILDLGMGEINEINICADEFEITDVKDKLKLYQSPVNVNSYCAFTPVGTYNTIQGKIKIDLNNNGCDNADAGMPAVPLRITDTSVNILMRYTSPAGDYAHYPYKGSFTLTPYFPYAYYTINPPSTNINFDTANNIIKTADFCISPNGVHNDLEITFLPVWPTARPGFDASYQLVYKNRGTTTLSGQLQLNFNNAKENFVSASPYPTLQSTGQLNWNYNNLLPFERKSIYITFNLLPPPINNIGDTLTYLATIDPSTGDETLYDNLFILPQRITGSYDPNDKLCLEGEKIDISAINKPLHYVIHFQNMGNDTAFNIVVADTLSNKFDWDSFEFIGSSHPCAVKQTNNRLEFIFENIKLPYKSINEPASNGFVAFKIKPKNTVFTGDSLNNKAAIYFDFNPPVITNLATTIVSSATTPVPVKIEYFAANNKGAVNVLNWKAACTNGSATFSIERSADGINFSSIGKLTASSVRCQLPFNFTDKEPVAGKNHYRLKITDADGLSFYSKTIVIGINKPGIEILTIVNTKNNSSIFFNASRQQKVQLKLIGADGKLLYSSGKTVPMGNSYIDLPMSNMAPGVYTLIAYTGEGNIVTKRFVR